MFLFITSIQRISILTLPVQLAEKNLSLNQLSVNTFLNYLVTADIPISYKCLWVNMMKLLVSLSLMSLLPFNEEDNENETI